MAPLDSDTHDRIYRAIKGDILDGSLAPASRLVGATFARKYHASLTPVREAIYRLVGEGLVAMRLGGFYVIATQKQTLIDMLELSQKLLVIGLQKMEGNMSSDLATLPVEDMSAAQVVARLEAIFHMVFAATRNDAIMAIGHTANERLRAMRIADCRANRRGRAEVQILIELVLRGERGRLGRQIRAHHRRHRNALLHSEAP